MHSLCQTIKKIFLTTRAGTGHCPIYGQTFGRKIRLIQKIIRRRLISLSKKFIEICICRKIVKGIKSIGIGDRFQPNTAIGIKIDCSPGNTRLAGIALAVGIQIMK